MQLADIATLNTVVIGFWLLPWSQPFRALCRWFALDEQPLQGRALPHQSVPRFVRPVLVQRWVAQAIAARLAWLEAHPQEQPYRYGKESRPCWEDVAWKRYDWRILHQFDDAMLLWIFGMEVERLLRLTDADPRFVGAGRWTCAALGASEHLAQLYYELKRRHRAMPARAMLWAELARLVDWQASEDTPGEAGE
jgi:hypothetical protein